LLSQAFKNNDVGRIILTRPAIEAGEKLGFLPGDLQQKVDPYLRPLYDALFGGYDLLNCSITFVTKFLMAWICAKIAFSGGTEAGNHSRNIAACVAGALSYVAIYMLKTFVFQMFVYGYPMETAVVTMGSKLPASLLNAIAAMIATPVLYAALSPALRQAGQLEKMRA